MQLSPDAIFQRHDLRQLAKAHPEDKALASIVGIMRGQILLYEIAPHDGMIAVAERARIGLEDRLHQRGYEWPPQPACLHRRLTGASWSKDGKHHTRLRCKDCGAVLNQ